MKNSSRLFAEMDRKRSRSRTGWFSFSASSSTRRLKCSQESSRLMNRSGLAERSCSGTTGATGTPLGASLDRFFLQNKSFAAISHEDLSVYISEN